MRDLTTVFHSAEILKEHWNFKAIMNSLHIVANCNPSWTIDWDYLAGESWGTVVSPRETIVLICTKVPLFFIIDTFFEHISSQLNQLKEGKFILIPVSQFNLKQFTIEPQILNRLFDLDIADSNFDEERFSVNDLWYSTV